MGKIEINERGALLRAKRELSIEFPINYLSLQKKKLHRAFTIESKDNLEPKIIFKLNPKCQRQ